MSPAISAGAADGASSSRSSLAFLAVAEADGPEGRPDFMVTGFFLSMKIFTGGFLVRIFLTGAGEVIFARVVVVKKGGVKERQRTAAAGSSLFDTR